MKPQLALSLVLLGSAWPVLAQSPVGSRALVRAEVARQEWPTFVRSNQTGSDSYATAIQLLLRNQGFFKGKTDGVFGSGTEGAVKRFQRARKLKVDGRVGAQTWAKLCPRLKRGDKGDAVRAMQTLLGAGADGSFGFATETALRTFQREYELKADGVAGAQTWAVLLAPEGC